MQPQRLGHLTAREINQPYLPISSTSHQPFAGRIKRHIQHHVRGGRQYAVELAVRRLK